MSDNATLAAVPPHLPQLTEWQLMRLRDCAGSSKYGMADRGFPSVMRELAGFGLVELLGERQGAKITAAGTAFLADPEIKQQLKRLGGCV